VHEVTLLRRSPGSSEFTPFGSVQTNFAGYFSRSQVLDLGAQYRYSWTETPADAEAAPRVRLSGIVDLRQRAARRLRAGAALAP
jgi:hypothetical protein